MAWRPAYQRLRSSEHWTAPWRRRSGFWTVRHEELRQIDILNCVVLIVLNEEGKDGGGSILRPQRDVHGRHDHWVSSTWFRRRLDFSAWRHDGVAKLHEARPRSR